MCVRNHNRILISKYSTTIFNISKAACDLVTILYVMALEVNQTTPILKFVYIDTDINPLSPHDALKHHFTFLKTDLIFL